LEKNKIKIFIDSRIPEFNIAKYMIEKYWKKYFMELYEIKNKADLYQMITDFGFKKIM